MAMANAQNSPQGLRVPVTLPARRIVLCSTFQIIMQGVVTPRSIVHRPAVLPPRRSTALRPLAFQQANSATLERTAYKGDPSKALEVDAESIAKDIRKKAEVTVGAPDLTEAEEAYRAAAWSVREKLFDAFFATQKYWECAVCPPCMSAAQRRRSLGLWPFCGFSITIPA